MQIPSFIFLIHLLSSISIGHGRLNIQRSKRKYSNVPLLSGSYNCLPGCATCSPLNGCLSCKPRFFFHLVLEGIRQRGVCLTSCPRGHYGVRSPHVMFCSYCPAECKPDCASCFSEHFCTRCHPGSFLFQGKCGNSCPNGLALMRCNPQKWTSWIETRTRQVPHFLRVHADPFHLCSIRCGII
uniref:R-spondin Fu-CRD domain-containing protein n=1 Tax=Oryzias latipes TaxID=8090 RepID=A0A3B3HDW8_ORYLA